jgi:hypothetical protein
MWAVVEGKRNYRTMSPNSINNIGCESLYRAQDREGFDPEHRKMDTEASATASAAEQTEQQLRKLITRTVAAVKPGLFARDLSNLALQR